MTHSMVGSKPGKLGVWCSCGFKSNIEKTVLKHVNDENKLQESALMAEQTPETNKNIAQEKTETPAQYRSAEKEVTLGGQQEPAESEAPKAAATPAPKNPDTEKAIQTPPGKISIQAYLRSDVIQKRLNQTLGKRTNQFVTALIAATSNVAHLDECTPASIINAALTVAALDLPINNNLGFAYIIPYLNSKKVDNAWVKEYEAQFQMGWKGFIQLAQRSGQYKTIAATQVYDGQLVSTDPLLGNTFDWLAKKSDQILGYVAQFQLMNGFSKDLYMTLDEVKEHANRFSQAYRSDQEYDKKKSPWSNDFDSMAQKTVIKMLVSKFGPMSIDPQMQIAVERDQAVIEDDGEVYVDNQPEYIERIASAESREDLKQIMASLSVEDKKNASPMIEAKMREVQ